MEKPKNRQAHFTRTARGPTRVPQEWEGEIPRGSKQEIRHMILEEGATSTCKIAEKLNTDGFPTATGVEWTAALVDSALRRQDMEGLRDVLRQNRGEEEPASAGASSLEIRQAVFDGVQDALRGTPFKASIPDDQIRSALKEATDDSLKAFRAQVKDQHEATILKVHQNLQTALQAADLQGIKRITERTATNVGDVHKRIEALCEDVYESTVKTLGEHSKAVVDACETMGATLYERVDERFDTLESKLIEKLTAGIDIDLDAALERVVDARLKLHLDTVVNQFAVMVEKLRKDLVDAKQKGR